MKLKLIFISLLTFVLVSFSYQKFVISQAQAQNIRIQWVEYLNGDYSFKDNWSYPEGIYKNQFGQLSCDGICPEGIDQMKDDKGRILEDSLAAFYKLVDTTHTHYSIMSKARCYEWAGTDFIEVRKNNQEIVECATVNNVSTHSSLNMEIKDEFCRPAIILNSILDQRADTFNCSGGYIKIDKTLWVKGVLKAEFDFIFDNKIEQAEPMYWKGKIYSTIDIE